MLRNYTGKLNYPPTSNELKWLDAKWNVQKLLCQAALYENQNNGRPVNVGVTSVAYVAEIRVAYIFLTLWVLSVMVVHLGPTEPSF